MFVQLVLISSAVFVPSVMSAKSWMGLTCKDNKMTGNLPECSKEEPCNEVFFTYKEDTLTEEYTPFRCSNNAIRKSDLIDDGKPKTITVNGQKRYYCLYVPPPYEGKKAPLVIFFHGTGGSPEALYKKNNLRKYADTFPLKGTREGYAVMAIQSRIVHWPSPPGDSAKHDYLTRNYDINKDYLVVDKIVDKLVKNNVVHKSHIYVSGHSNGAQFGMQYAYVRGVTPTPGGNKVKAGAVYSGGDPFGVPPSSIPTCVGDYPKTKTPVMMIQRDCDLAPCAPAARFMRETVPQVMGNTRSEFIILDSENNEVKDCASKCGIIEGIQNHSMWPFLYEQRMLNFMKKAKCTGARRRKINKEKKRAERRTQCRRHECRWHSSSGSCRAARDVSVEAF